MSFSPPPLKQLRLSSFWTPLAARQFRTGLALAAAVLAAACSGKGSGTGAPELPASCNAFVAKYEQCITASVPSMPQVAKERAAQTRAALEAEAKRATAGPSPAGSGPHDLTALATKCNDNLQRLPASCGSSRTN